MEDELDEVVGVATAGIEVVGVDAGDVVVVEGLVDFELLLLTDDVLEAVSVKVGPDSGLSSGLSGEAGGAGIIWKSASGMSQHCALLSAKPQQY